MKIRALCFTASGAEVLQQLQAAFPAEQFLCRIRSARALDTGLETLTEPAADFVRAAFEEGTPLVVVGATGIAVRLITPCLKDKLQDIPVLVIDEGAHYVIPICSGHVGGANTLARRFALALQAEAVITTATDVNGCFSVDEFARENRLTIRNKDAIKTVSSRALRAEPIRIAVKDFQPGEAADVVIGDDCIAEGALWLSPKPYVLGIGCRRGKTLAEIETAVGQALQKLGIGYEDIYAFASVDRKAEEEGLKDFSARHRIPFVCFSGEMLMRLPGNYSASDFVRQTVGTDNVCERAAMLLTRGLGTLVLKKQAADGVTVAVARRYGV